MLVSIFYHFNILFYNGKKNKQKYEEERLSPFGGGQGGGQFSLKLSK